MIKEAADNILSWELETKEKGLKICFLEMNVN